MEGGVEERPPHLMGGTNIEKQEGDGREDFRKKGTDTQRVKVKKLLLSIERILGGDEVPDTDLCDPANFWFRPPQHSGPVTSSPLQNSPDFLHHYSTEPARPWPPDTFLT